MKFSCEKAVLQPAIAVAARAVSPKSTIPALEGILLEAGRDLRLTGYNLETGIRATVPAQIEQEGALVLPSRLLGEIIRKLPDDVVLFSAKGLTVHIQCGMSEFHIQATDPEDFPELPLVEYQHTFSLPQRTLRAMLGQTLFAVSDNESRPVHTGALFEVEGETLNLVAVDGFRLALRREPVSQRAGECDFSFVAPGAALSEVEKICGDTDALAEIAVGARHILFKVGDAVLVSRRLEGEFLSWRQAVPRNNTLKLQVETRSLLSSIERVSLIISEKLKSPLRCVFGDGEIQISTHTALGNATDKCFALGDGNGLQIGFNFRYLMDALKAAPAERVRMELQTGVSPCVILPVEGEENFIYMVLPVRLKAET